MSMGPIIIFDKSLLQSLNPDEALWLDHFFNSNVTPLFYIETLADLAKNATNGRPAEKVVMELAYKSPEQGMAPNVHHKTLVIHELLGNPVKMEMRPVLPGGKIKEDYAGKIGVVFNEFPEAEAFERWQNAEFLEVERHFATKWRRDLGNTEFINSVEWVRNLVPINTEFSNISEVQNFAEYVVSSSGKMILLFALQFLDIPESIHKYVADAYEKEGMPPIKIFSPYMAHILKLDVFFNICLMSGFISQDRPSNRIDLAYLYYLPFSMAFISGDKLHSRIAKGFMDLGQEFIPASEMKSALKEINEYYSRYETEIEKQGIIKFASYPPIKLNNAVTCLWDKFCPNWRQHSLKKSSKTETSLPNNDELVKRIREQELAPESSKQIDGDSADFLIIKRKVPVRKGKWRILPPEVENNSSEKS